MLRNGHGNYENLHGVITFAVIGFNGRLLVCQGKAVIICL